MIWTAFLICVTVLGFCCAILDRVIAEERMLSFRASMDAFVSKLNSVDRRGISDILHSAFAGLFDRIYGRKFLSFRRIATSVVSTTGGLFVLTLVFGYENTLWSTVLDPAVPHLLAVPLLFNYVPDFFSLQETRLVMGWARGRGPTGIVGLLILDLALTLMIFLLGVFMWFTVSWILVGDLEEGFWQECLEIVSTDFLFDPYQGLLPLLTTFVTSFFWIAFVVSFLSARIVHWVMRPFANRLLAAISASERPASTAFGLVAGLLAVCLAVLTALQSAL